MDVLPAQVARRRRDGLHSELSYKRLDKGTYRLPEALEPDGTVVLLGERDLDDLLDGIDVEPPRARRKRSSRVRFH